MYILIDVCIYSLVWYIIVIILSPMMTKYHKKMMNFQDAPLELRLPERWVKNCKVIACYWKTYWLHEEKI